MVEDDNQFLEVEEEEKLKCRIYFQKTRSLHLEQSLPGGWWSCGWKVPGGRWTTIRFSILNSQAGSIQTFQWRVVANAMDSCTLPIFSKLVFQEVCRWDLRLEKIAWTNSADGRATLLQRRLSSWPMFRSRIMNFVVTSLQDSVFQLFQRVENKHGWMLVVSYLVVVNFHFSSSTP